MSSRLSRGDLSSTVSSAARSWASCRADRCRGSSGEGTTLGFSTSACFIRHLSCPVYLTLDDGYCRAFVEAFSRKKDMPRPKLHSDEFILDTALGILLQKGSIGLHPLRCCGSCRHLAGCADPAVQGQGDAASKGHGAHHTGGARLFRGRESRKGPRSAMGDAQGPHRRYGCRCRNGRLPPSIVGRHSGAVASHPCGGAEQAGPESYRGTTARRAAPPRAYRWPDSDGHSGVLHAVAC